MNRLEVPYFNLDLAAGGAEMQERHLIEVALRPEPVRRRRIGGVPIDQPNIQNTPSRHSVSALDLAKFFGLVPQDKR